MALDSRYVDSPRQHCQKSIVESRNRLKLAELKTVFEGKEKHGRSARSNCSVGKNEK